MTSAPAATDRETIVRVEDLDAGYGNMQIVFDVSMEMRKGQIVAIIGPNGAGKSTVLKSILGLLVPMRGKILYRDRDITGMPPNRVIEMGMGYVPQGRIVFPDMTVKENLEMGGFTSRDPEVFDRSMERCFELFPILKDRIKQRAGTLSGGQQQMLAVGRAIMADPDTIILDEPSLGLAPKFVDTVFDALERMREQGFTLIMVEQNAARALELADYGYVLDVGRNRFEGPGGELLEDGQVQRLYLGG